MKLFSFGIIILGAGASARMGKPKLLLPWGNTSVVGHIFQQWQSLGAAQIAIVHRPQDEQLFQELDRLNFPAANRIKNPQPERGMFSSIACAANWNGWQHDLDSWAIALGDQPQIKIETLRALLASHGERPGAICQPEFDGHGRHPVLLPRQALVELKNSPAQTLQEFLKMTACSSVKCRMLDSGLSLDLDTPEDYQRSRIFQPNRA